MTWTQTTPEEERTRFVLKASAEELEFAELCRLFSISRKTGYKWLDRYRRDGAAGLEARSSAPHTHPFAVGAEVRERVIGLREEHATWGPRKLLAFLERHAPKTKWPAPSTVGELLRCAGLVRPRRRRRHCPPATQPFVEAREPNDLWCADFKGQFPVGKRMCYPLTVTDAASRYVLGCDALRSTETSGAKAGFEGVFQKYGLPGAIRTDNGSPFASTGAGGLSRLSVWWVHLGILPERIEPGEPQQNGRHERMHLTLELEATTPARRSFAAQQRVFDEWRRVFNHERPHEALDMRTPGDLYVPSRRSMPSVLPEVEYPGGWELRRVRHDGTMKWRNRHLYVSAALVGELVGLRPEDGGLWTGFFGPILLGRVHDEALDLGLVRPSRRQWTDDEEGE